MKMHKLLITGCGGQLGRAVNREFGGDNRFELMNTDAVSIDGVDSSVLNITKIDEVMDFARQVKPDGIINCAAYTAVDQQEKDVDLSYRINAVGARNLAIAAEELHAKLIHVSTDYVFDGSADKPYIEFDRPCPASVYGKTKLAGEEFVKSFSSRFFILRTAWLYGDGKNFVKTMLRLSENHDEVSVVMDQKGSPTSAAELARAIHALIGTENYGLFHATCEGDTEWATFAETIFSLAGKKTKVNRITTEEYQKMNPTSAPRPAYSILDNYMLRLTDSYQFADWKDAIKEYMI